MLYWFSATHYHESALGRHVSPTSWTSLPPPTPSPAEAVTERQAESRRCAPARC